MSWEIERRFLVRVEGAMWHERPGGRRLRQGYVRSEDPSVRIRVGEERGPVLASKRGSGVRRQEFEVVVTPEIADALFHAAGTRIIEKVRWEAGRWEVDLFMGSLEGLALMEIELEHERDVLPEPPKGITILREVTDDKRFTSSSLAECPDRDRRELVSALNAEVGL